MLVGIGAVVAILQAFVLPWNFGGADEWLALELTSRGILDVPYANRPLVFLWVALAQGAWPNDLRAFWSLTALAFWVTGTLTAWLASRMVPSSPELAFAAGVLAAVWAPLDYLRLDTTLIAGYAGFTATALGAVILFLVSWRAASRPLLLLAGSLVLLASRGVESIIPFVAVAPLLATPQLVSQREAGALRRLLRWTLAWAGFVVVAAAFAVAPKLMGTASYQEGALGLDLRPAGIVVRLGQLLQMQTTPLLTSDPRELANGVVAGAVLAFLVGALAVRLVGTSVPASRRDALIVAVLGLTLASAGHLGLALTRVIRTPARTQVLSTPGTGLALAAVFLWLASWLPARVRPWGMTAFVAWAVAVGAGRVVAMQAEWNDGRNAFPSQRRALLGLVREAPGLRPNTLVVLVDGADIFPTTFSFRHAVALLYPGQAIGLVHAGHPFLYPWHREHDDIVVVPWPVIREGWGVSVSRHRPDEVIAVRPNTAGALAILSSWPAERLGPLARGERYAPRERVVRGLSIPASRRLLSASD